MQIIHQTQKCAHCSAESYLACFCDIVQNHFDKNKSDKCSETMANYVNSLNWNCTERYTRNACSCLAGCVFAK